VDATQLSQPQKVAAVMLALGAHHAEAVLKHLPDSEVELVAQEVVALPPLSPRQLQAVLEEFHAEAYAQKFMLSGGEHTARELLRGWRGDRGDAIVDRLVATVRETPFGFLTYFGADDIARQLREEHPQMAAVVLSNVSTRLAAQVLEALPEKVRADVAIRIATIEPSPPELVARIENNLRARLGDATSMPIGLSGAGLRELANMLNNTGLELAKTILASIEQVDERLAKEIRAQMFVFTDLITLPDRDMQEVLRQIETSQLALAMKALDGELYDAIMRNLSERGRTGLTEELELLGPVKAADIALARAEIAAHVRQLADEGTVTIMRDGSDLVV
jgi:flagellar motor switch protein FliG